MAEIIRPRERKTVIEHSYFFQRKGDYQGNGYSFPCDEHGNVKFSPEYEDIQRKNYEYAMESDEYADPYIETRSWSYTENALARCECGDNIELYNEYLGACECPNCGRWHNCLSGQLLNPVETWADGDDW